MEKSLPGTLILILIRIHWHLKRTCPLKDKKYNPKFGNTTTTVAILSTNKKKNNICRPNTCILLYYFAYFS